MCSDSLVGESAGGRRIEQNRKKEKELVDMDNSVVIVGGKQWEEEEVGMGGYQVMGKD